MIIPFEKLNPDTLTRLLEEFVTRDGTDSGYVGQTLAQNVAAVRRQLERGKAFLVYDPVTQRCNIVSKEHIERHR